MKKLFLSLVAAMMAATAMYAQGSLVVTLNHDNNISVFSGTGAFADAMSAAENGDMVTLGDGIFDATDITKAVKIRGNGIDNSRISDNFSINIPDGVTERLSVEGIYFNGKVTPVKLDNATFSKCRFYEIYAHSSQTSYRLTNTSFTNCRIDYNMKLTLHGSAYFTNCVVCSPQSVSSSSSTRGFMEFTNCYIYDTTNTNYQRVLTYNCQYSNCIIDIRNNTKSVIDSSNLCSSCIGTGTNVFANVNQTANTELTEEDFNALFVADSFYELTDAAKAAYKGNDGSEVGVYGGVLPYDTTISNPKITKCLVAPKTTLDGKLSVDIEVEAAE